jgi:repressor LexA
VDGSRGVSDRPDRAAVAPRRRVYSDVRDFLLGSGSRATVFDVCDAVGLEISYRLKVLQVNGPPRRGAAGRSKAWERWERRFGHPALLIEADDLPGEVTLPFQIGAAVLVPVCGWIPAGPLNLANQASESAFLLDKRPIGEGTHFMLKVVGDSMINAGIADGNWVVVRQSIHMCWKCVQNLLPVSRLLGTCPRRSNSSLPWCSTPSECWAPSTPRPSRHGLYAVRGNLFRLDQELGG